MCEGGGGRCECVREEEGWVREEGGGWVRGEVGVHVREGEVWLVSV